METVTSWRKGPWTPEEDKLLIQYISHNGEGRWSCVSKFTGLKRSGKSCRLRWVNYLRPGLKKGHFTPQEEGIIIELHALWGNKWSTIARCLPGRTDNEIKNYWRTHFKPIRKPSEKKRKILSQEFETDHQGKSIINEPFQLAEENIKKEAEITFPTIENHHQFLPMVNEEITASDVIPFDCYLWGGLWNLDGDGDDDPKRLAVDQNQGNGVSNCYYSFEGEAVDYVQGGGFIF